LFIVSDHGFRAIKRKIHPNVLLRARGLISGEKGGARGDAWVLSTGGTAMVDITNPTRKRELVPQLSALLSGVEGIEHVYGPDEIAKLGLPTPPSTDQAPDLVLAATLDYYFANESTGDLITPATGGTHGYLNSDPKMQSIFIAWGARIPQGIRLDKISDLDVAPTIAALLGFQMKEAKGRAIPEIVGTRLPK
jgi:predicted AlkP superfamily pyrophosphatase or phosphodiesterase